MGARLSQQNGKKRVSSRLQPNSSKSTVSSNNALGETSSKKPSSISSQSSEGVIRNGRKFHNTDKSTYWFPNDDEELDRLIGQHFALKTLFDGNIPTEVIENAGIDKGAKVLDLGSGPGTWLMDVATEHPASEFIGIDMSDVFPSTIRPPNVSFKLGNILEGLDYPDNTFDMVHFRFFILAFKKDEWIPILKEVMRVLKPGGYIVSKEAGMLEVGNDFVKWAGKVFKDRMIERGQEPYICFEIKNHLENAGYDVVEHIKRDTFPGRADHLNREFLWDLRSVFKSGQPFLAEPLNICNEKYPAFLERLVIEIQKKPEAQWSMTSTVGRKPF
ncbi:S-adenosyl-L-methionine-dependent methyltransferase [Backusella circina FSU 941]|nr:S-adenosyl-L-methionine-dependent methyltransferase [Backusella circina FSU 941]